MDNWRSKMQQLIAKYALNILIKYLNKYLFSSYDLNGFTTDSWLFKTQLKNKLSILQQFELG